ncbi:glycoside hydrolase family 43 protein [Kineothrix sp. MB12-C1]|uniref:glycoside hydrolase family 43 protein n=1 Tax=Kineothrix sp. MB12-C1 TaxID=3070215 RepID=UPI0027D320D0|nr:glycoside hydrolase family 43 protein [Kineothrix sp. MB12-C1]WMC93253.1 glycoside hydrolase family 43 protein [Kineothrix sp. MB12-C1]
MKAYLFVHFKEKKTPDGEQVYFGLSKDGFHWKEVNGGNPVLWSYEGDKGVRDFTIVRTEDGKFRIVATDLSLAYGMPNQYHNSWDEIGRNGSRELVMWESQDLIHWSWQKMITLGGAEFGCRWAPDIIRDKENGDYILHWSSPHECNNYGEKAIYYTRTKTFEEFSAPELLYRKEDSGVIDSCMVEESGIYYLFVKSEENPATIILLKSTSPTGPFERMDAFDEEMSKLQAGVYEAPTAFRLEDGRWCLMFDYYGVPGKGQGYVPFLCEDISKGVFKRADAQFSFPYGFKHGTVLEITMEEYERIKGCEFES